MSRLSNMIRASLEEIQDDLVGDTTDTTVDVSADQSTNEETFDDAEAVVEVPAVVSADEVVVDNSDSLEEAVAEVAEAEAETVEEETKIEELEEAAAGLESIYNLLKDSQQRGGLTAAAAQMAHLAVESYTQRLGLDESPMASMESFGGDSSRLNATQMSMEAIGERLKTVWAAIVKFLMNLKDKVWQFIKRLVLATERMKSRGEKLTKIQLQGQAQSATIEMKGYAKKIAIGSNVKTNAKAGMAELIQVVQGAAVLDKAQLAQVETLQTMAAQAAAGTLKADQMQDISFKVTPPAGFTDKGGLLFTPVLPGNVRFVLGKKSVGKFEFAVVSKRKEDVKISEEAKIPTMSVDDIRATGAAVIALYSAVKELNAAAERSSAAVKKLGNVSGKEVAEADRAAINDILKAYRSAAANQGQLSAKVAAHAVDVAATYIKIAEKSAAQYKGKSTALATTGGGQ